MSATDDTPPRVESTYDELDVLAIAGTDRMLRLPFIGGERRVPIPGDLSIPVIAGLMVVEKKIDEAEEGGDLIKAFEAATGEIMRVVRIRTPDAPDPDLDEFGFRRITSTLAWLAGDASVANAIASTLMAGADVPGEAEPVVTVHAASERDDGDDEVHGEVPGPLVSSELSSTPSSPSDGSTVGGPSGGDTQVSDRSGSTSPTPEPATANA